MRGVGSKRKSGSMAWHGAPQNKSVRLRARCGIA